MSAVNYHYGEFPPRELEWPKLIPYLGPAYAAVAKYDGLLERLFLMPKFYYLP